MAMTEEHEIAAWLKGEVARLAEKRWLGHLDDLRLAMAAANAGMTNAEVAALMSAPEHQIDLWLAEAKGRALGWEEGREAALRVKHGRPRDAGTVGVVQELGAYLPAELIASLAGVPDVNQVSAWAQGTEEPPATARVRLGFALEQARRIAGAESVKVSASWLITANEQLGNALPLKAIREDRFDAVARAVEAFVDGYAG